MSVQPAAVPVAATGDQADIALEFVRFCYRRRQVAWPTLYDEMSVVAARGLFRGLSFFELTEQGVSFCLDDLPRLAALTERVEVEQRRLSEPRPENTAISLVGAPATT